MPALPSRTRKPRSPLEAIRIGLLLSDRKGNARYSLAVDPLERNKRVSDTPEKSDLGPETGTQDEHMKNPNRSTEHQKKGDARLPSDRLDRDQPRPEETIPRKSSLT